VAVPVAGSPRSFVSWAGSASRGSGSQAEADGRPQGLEGVLPGPAFGQVEGQRAAACGQPGWDGDQLAADGAGAGSGVEQGGEGAQRAGEVVGERGEGEPGRVRG